MIMGINALVAPPVSRLAALLGAGLLLLGSAQLRPRAHAYRLGLSAPSARGAVYFSAWETGAVVLDHDGSDGKTVELKRRFLWVDACEWEAVETLRPLSADRYRYDYDEHFVSCPEGVSPSGMKTPRRGLVTVERAEAGAPLTALEGVARGRGWAEALAVGCPIDVD